jgi:hypothetical protein
LKNQNLPFVPRNVVHSTISIRQALILGKEVARIVRYFDGHLEFVTPKMIEAEKRAAEDAALAEKVAAQARAAALVETINAATRVEPTLKDGARKMLLDSTKTVAEEQLKITKATVELEQANLAAKAARLLLQE